MNQRIYDFLTSILKKESILIDEPMKKHTSFKIGGPADFFVMPETFKEVALLLKGLKEEKIPFIVMGNGSNMLVRDKGIRGVVVQIAENLSSYEITGNLVKAQSGVLLSALSRDILRNSLAGFEFAGGIPGTLGGAVAMNAGAYGGEMKDIIESVTLVDEKGEIKTYSNEEMNFRYRGSKATDQELIVLETAIRLEEGNYDEIKEKIDDLTQKRVTKQPLSMPSAGSTFKRPPGYFAGKLIEDSGLKGVAFRGAQVSEKHSGFVINRGDATAEEVLTLLSFIKKTVYDKFQVLLEEEVKIIGEV